MGPKLENLKKAGECLLAATKKVFEAYVRCGLLSVEDAQTEVNDVDKHIERNIKNKLAFEDFVYPTHSRMDQQGLRAVEEHVQALKAFNLASDERVTPTFVFHPRKLMCHKGTFLEGYSVETEDD